jgi:hypothetical protein
MRSNAFDYLQPKRPTVIKNMKKLDSHLVDSTSPSEINSTALSPNVGPGRSSDLKKSITRNLNENASAFSPRIRRRSTMAKIMPIDGTVTQGGVTDDSQRCNREDFMTRSRNTDSAAISVNDFRKYAEQASAVAIISHHARLKVIAVGTTPDGRAIAWLDPNIDTARHFMDALDDAFGERVGAQTALELTLTPTPGKALPSALVHRAIDMAQTAKTAMDGVDFLNDMTRQGSDLFSFGPEIVEPSDPV